MSRRLAALLTVALAATASQDPIFRSGTREVLVDAVVLDKKGNFQRDLTQQDFKLFEDGKEQKITSFSLESLGGPGHFSKHFITLVFDSETPGLRNQVMQFVDRSASPDIYFAVFSRVNETGMRLQQPFTTEAGRVKAAIRNMQVTNAPPIIGRTPQHLPILDRIDAITAELAPVRGRKALILFSYGFIGNRGAPVRRDDGAYARPPNRPDPWVDTIARCNAANVSIYSFAFGKDAGVSFGDFYDRPADPSEDHGATTDRVRDLAVGTGGKYTPPGDYDLASYLASISKEGTDFYLLGFTPSSESAGQPCHKLRLKVDRAGLDVAARDSYCSTAQIGARSLSAAQRALDVRAASNLAANIAAGLQVSWFYTKPTEAVVDIAMDIDPRAVKMHGKLHGELNLSGIVYGDDGSIAARIPDTVKLDFDSSEQLDAFLKTPYHYSRQFFIAPGDYRVRIAVGSDDQAFGIAEKLLEIDPWTGHTLSLSGIALAAGDYPLTDVTAELVSSLLEGPHRPAAKGRVVAPLGATQFPTGRNGLFYFEIYQPDLTQGLPAVSMRILDRATGEPKADSGPFDLARWIQPGNSVVPVALNLPISNLPAGSYTLEVRVAAANAEAALLRHADFEIK